MTQLLLLFKHQNLGPAVGTRVLFVGPVTEDETMALFTRRRDWIPCRFVSVRRVSEECDRCYRLISACQILES
jgi:hypothetical protein